jgi:hypothetical protein
VAGIFQGGFIYGSGSLTCPGDVNVYVFGSAADSYRDLIVTLSNCHRTRHD